LDSLVDDELESAPSRYHTILTDYMIDIRIH
jgi:hypothetical protein